MLEIAAGGAVFDRNFYKGSHGDFPDIHQSKMLTIKRSKSEGEEWAGGKWTPLSETYEMRDGLVCQRNLPDIKPLNYEKSMPMQPLQCVMKNALLRGFEKELRPEYGMALPNLEYIGNYRDEETGFLVYAYLGHLHSNTPWSPTRDFKKKIHPNPEEIDKVGWKTLPQIIEMTKKGKFVNEQFVNTVIQEIERRVTRDSNSHSSEYYDGLSRLMQGVPLVTV